MEDQVLQSTPESATNQQRRPRLTEEKVRDLHPWVRADTLEDCSLYWMSASAFPITHDERAWLLVFMEQFSKKLSEEHGLRSELFLQFKIASSDLSEAFRSYALKCKTLLGLSRKPGADLPKMPSADQLKEAMSDGKPFDLNQWVGDYCYWFRSKRPDEQRQLFLGYGGMTTLFLPPDPKTAPPKLPFTPAFRSAMPVFQTFDVDALIAGAFTLHDSFLPKSKELLGAGLEHKPEYASIMYIIPLLASGHFFAVKPEERESWFQLFDVYFNESPADQGFVLAFQKDYEPLLIEVLEQMRADGIEHPLKRGKSS